jgi:glycosyltransferase involved in cell wall biosynthesis
MNEPEVSVIVPVYNAERYLEEALTSIESQAVSSLEIIVVDDGSTDGSADIARRFHTVRYIHQGNRGPAAARNRGVALARGRSLAFLDADDLWAPGKLRLQLPLLTGEQGTDLVTGHVQCLTLGGAGEWSEFEVPRFLPLFGASVMTRSAFDRVGSLDESLRCAEDVDWFVRAREHGIRTSVLADVVLYYRLHGANLTQSAVPQDAGYTRVVRKLLERRRHDQRS